ncbi:hypothetical protein MJH12_02060 [bacterium]|nr:hypothetical protein [bacterium]
METSALRSTQITDLNQSEDQYGEGIKRIDSEGKPSDIAVCGPVRGQ